MTGSGGLPIDQGLLERFRSAGERIAWRPVASVAGKGCVRAPAPVRIAHLNDEEARVEEHGREPARRLLADSGPVGALVLLLEIDRRGPPALLRTHEAGEVDGFPKGALEARWGGKPLAGPQPLAVTDLVSLARYALA